MIHGRGRLLFEPAAARIMTLSCTLALAAAILTAQPAKAPTMTFTTIARGDQSKIDRPRTVVARTPSEWADLWKAHGGEGKTPAVDLTRSMVLAVFSGTRPTAGHTVEITAIEVRDKDLVVVYRERGPGPDELSAQVLTAPFHIVRSDQHTGSVRFQRTR